MKTAILFWLTCLIGLTSGSVFDRQQISVSDLVRLPNGFMVCWRATEGEAAIY